MRIDKIQSNSSDFHVRLDFQARLVLDGYLMTDSICHSSLPRTVLEKVTLTTIRFRIHPRTKVDPMFQCVYISTPLKSCPYKSSATCAWSMARVAEKTRLNICANKKSADQPARPRRTRRLITAFVVCCSSFFPSKKCLTNLNGEQNDTWNLLVSHRICHFRAIQPFDLPMRLFWLAVSTGKQSITIKIQKNWIHLVIFCHFYKGDTLFFIQRFYKFYIRVTDDASVTKNN